MSSNLPPGVTPGMIPGNRPEDEDEDNFWDLFHEKVDASHIDVEQVLRGPYEWPTSAHQQKAFNAMIIIARDIGYVRGYAEGRADKELELHMEQSPEDGS